jgi:hypothetical protein
VGLEVTVGRLVLVHDSIPPDRHRQVLNLYFLVSASTAELKVTQDNILRDAGFHPLAEFDQMSVKPDVKREIMEGIAKGWPECRYLGNEWKD